MAADTTKKHFIRIRGANVNNLKNLSVDIPRDKFVVFTGLSGSGKSSLAFDTIYAVTGVEPQFFIDSELQYDEITELIVTKDMAERKAKMIELGDAFIAFPGGTGTLEEIAEVMSMVSLKHLNAPCILYNLNGYYDSLKQLLDHMIKMGQGIYFADDMEDIKALLATVTK